MSDTAMVKYGAVDVEAVAADREQYLKDKAERKARAGFLKVEPGTMMIRVMPPWKVGVKLPYRKVWIHKLKSPQDLNGLPKASVPCPMKNNDPGKRCPICRRIQELRAAGDKDSKEYAFVIGAQERWFAQVVDLENPDKGVQLWEFGPKLYDQVANLLKGGDITHPDHGHNLTLERVGKDKLDTKYTLTPILKPSAISKREWLDNLVDLDALASDWAADKILAALEGKAEPEPAEGQEGAIETEYTPAGK